MGVSGWVRPVSLLLTDDLASPYGFGRFRTTEPWATVYRSCADGPDCRICRAMATAVGGVIQGAHP